MLATAMAAIDVTSMRMPVVLIGAPAMLGAARAAVAAIGARPVADHDWDRIVGGVELPATRCVFVVETLGADDAVLALALARIDAAAAALDAPVVVSLDDSAIDLVAAALFGPRVQLLCRPDATDWAVSLSLAARMIDGAPLSDTLNENEAVRLQRLTDEVARIADVLARLTRREAAEQGRGASASAHAVADRRQSFGVEPIEELVIDAAELRRAIRARRLRDQFFGAGLFEEPGWDMLLDLFAAELERSRVSVSSLCIAAAVAPTTALRWISKLTEAGLFERHPDPFDRRRAYMELSDRASRAMRDYIGALRRVGLSLA